MTIHHPNQLAIPHIAVIQNPNVTFSLIVSRIPLHVAIRIPKHKKSLLLSKGSKMTVCNWVNLQTNKINREI